MSSCRIRVKEDAQGPSHRPYRGPALFSQVFLVMTSLMRGSRRCPSALVCVCMRVRVVLELFSHCRIWPSHRKWCVWRPRGKQPTLRIAGISQDRKWVLVYCESVSVHCTMCMYKKKSFVLYYEQIFVSVLFICMYLSFFVVFLQQMCLTNNFLISFQ